MGGVFVSICDLFQHLALFSDVLQSQAAVRNNTIDCQLLTQKYNIPTKNNVPICAKNVNCHKLGHFWHRQIMRYQVTIHVTTETLSVNLYCFHTAKKRYGKVTPLWGIARVIVIV